MSGIVACNQPSGSTVISDLGDGINREIGQTFTIGTTAPNSEFRIASVTCKGFRTNSPGDITMELYAADSNDEPTGSLLATAVFDGDTLTTSTTGQEFTFNFTEVLLVPDQKYFIWLMAENDIVNGVRLIGTTSSSYSAGQVMSTVDDGTNWAANPTRDLFFKIGGDGKFLLVKATDGNIYQSRLERIP